jgi:hypothetical protein
MRASDPCFRFGVTCVNDKDVQVKCPSIPAQRLEGQTGELSKLVIDKGGAPGGGGAKLKMYL